jgi:hypothetical protein
MQLQINVTASRYHGTLPIEGTLLVSVQRHPVGRAYPHKVAWARKISELRKYPASERELLQVAADRLHRWLTSANDGMTEYDDGGQRVAESFMG